MRRRHRKTEGGIGTNQYGVRGQAKSSQIVVPALSNGLGSSDDVQRSAIATAGEACRLRMQTGMVARLEQMAIDPARKAPPNQSASVYVIASPDHLPIDLTMVHRLQDPICTAAELETQSRSAISEVQTLVALHLNTAPGVLKRLSRNGSHHVQMGVAVNPNCPPTSLKRMAKDNLWDAVRAEVLHNPHCPAEVSDRLLNDPSPLVQASHPRTSLERLAELSVCFRRLPDGTTHQEIRTAVASNPSCPLDILINLALDSYPVVQQAALENPRCPEHIRAVITLGR